MTAPDTTVPDVVPADSVGEWSATADVVIVGFGLAGACAAIEAAEAGADVLVIERAGGSGGTTMMAAGHFYLGGGTPVQDAAGYDDTPDDMFRYLEAVTPEPDVDKIRLYCDESVEHFHWLEAHGVEFERSFYPGKAAYQPGTEGLMWTGNEKVWPYIDMAKPAPRGHKVAAPGDGGGATLMTGLTERVTALGVRVVYDTGVLALVTDESGAAVGVQTSTFGEIGHVRATRGVVLAAGGYVMNKEMIAEHTPRLAKQFYAIGNPHDDGLGIRLGVSAGGEMRHMDGAFISAPFYPPGDLLKGIIVNRNGERFVAEDSYHGRTATFVLDQPDAVAYLITDSECVGWPELGLTPFIDGFETIGEMEQRLELPAGSLEQTLTEYNRNAADSKDPAFHKHAEWLKPLDAGPWAAFDLTPGKAMYVGFTLGGLNTSIDAEVLSAADGTPIPRLYAAGACASNIAQDANGYSSGTCIGESSYFGRRAGRHVAQQEDRE